MVVAKRQKREKSAKNGRKENLWTEVRTSGKTNMGPSKLSQLAQGRLKAGRRQMYKRRKPSRIEASPLG